MNNSSKVIDVSEEEFNEKVVNQSIDKLVIVDFWAPWCGPCKQLTPILENVVNRKKGKVILAKINVDENQGISSQLNIQSIPTVYGFVNGKRPGGVALVCRIDKKRSNYSRRERSKEEGLV